MDNTKNYKWNYCSLGGVVRVNIASGEDIAHLDELDQKLWTVLSCPVHGLEFDPVTLHLLDTDGDGKIRVGEIVDAAKWLTRIIKDKDLILKGDDSLPLAEFNTEDPDGARLLRSAKQILGNLGLEKDEISLADASDSVAIFAKTQSNGDGIVTPASTSDAVLSKTISDCISTIGSVVDRSGEKGVNAELIEKFYDECAGYSAWMADADAHRAEYFPYGEDTLKAMAACDALRGKMADYFMRCDLVNFNPASEGVLGISVERISQISAGNVAEQSEQIASYPLAVPSAARTLPLDGINPAWQASFSDLKSIVLDKDYKGRDSISEADWKDILAKFAPYKSWQSAVKGTVVAPLGIETVNSVLAAGRKAELLALVEADLALKAESESIDEVSKLLYLYRDFYKLLCNYVIFTDFYSRDPERRSIFEAGRLYIDQRCCNLCIKVSDMGAHAGMAGLSGMFLIYCKCSSKLRPETMDIVAVMTAGDVKNLRPGKNAIFYDREGGDWDAVVTSIVDNPISVRQAFFSPYVKFWNFCVGLLNKSAADKDSKMLEDLKAKAETAASAPADAG